VQTLLQEQQSSSPGLGITWPSLFKYVPLFLQVDSDGPDCAVEIDAETDDCCGCASVCGAWLI
jgi:hypothetical protein